MAAKAGIDQSWLNDAVKGYLSPRGEFDHFLELPHLKVFVAQPRYLLAMKCAAMRLGKEVHDLFGAHVVVGRPVIRCGGFDKISRTELVSKLSVMAPARAAMALGGVRTSLAL